MRRLRDNPLSAEDVHVIPGAAGGPKALGLNGLDKTLFGHWLPSAPQPRALVGSSIGSWRFAAVASSDNPVAQLELLAELYTQQRFIKGVSAAEVTRKSFEFLQQLLGGREQHILNHPQYRLSVMVVRSLGLLRHDSRGRLTLGLLHTIALNQDNLLPLYPGASLTRHMCKMCCWCRPRRTIWRVCPMESCRTVVILKSTWAMTSAAKNPGVARLPRVSAWVMTSWN